MIEVDPDDKMADRFLLTVPLTDGQQTFDSGVFRYKVLVIPKFETHTPGDRLLEEDAYQFTIEGLTPVLRHDKTKYDFTNPNLTKTPQSYPDFSPAFGAGWQLEGVPKLFLDRDYVNNASGLHGDTDRGPKLMLQMPGSDRIDVFRGNTAGTTFEFAFEELDPFDLDRLAEDKEQYGTMTAVSHNEMKYEDGFGTTYIFRRFNVPVDPMAVGQSFETRPVPQWRIEEIKAPDDQGLKFEYRDDVSTPRDPSVNTDDRFVGDLRLHKIVSQKQTENGPDQGSLTFEYDPGETRAKKVLFSDGREIILDTTGEQLSHIRRPLGNGSEIRHEFDYETIGDANHPRDVLKEVRDIDADGLADTVVTLKYEDDRVIEVTDGQGGGQAIVSKLDTLIEFNEDAEALFETPDDENPLHAVAAKVEVSDLQRLNDQTLSPESRKGDFVTQYTVDPRSNVTKLEHVFEHCPADAPGCDSDDKIEKVLEASETVYDTHDNPVKVIDTLGRITEYTYDYEIPVGTTYLEQLYEDGDARGNIVRIDSPSGSSEFSYSTDDDKPKKFGKLLRHVDVRDLKTKFEYDDDGRVIETTELWSQEDRVSTYQFNVGTDLPTSVESALGLTTEFVDFDASGRRPKTLKYIQSAGTTQGGEAIPAREWKTITKYDSYGYVESTKTEEKVNGNFVEISFEKLEHDAIGRLLSRKLFEKESDPNSLLEESSYKYDSTGRLIEAVDGRGAKTIYKYNTAGLLLEFIIAEGATFDAASDSTTAGIPIQHKTVYQYYADGSMKSEKTPDGTTISYFTDPAYVNLASIPAPPGGVETTAPAHPYDIDSQSFLTTHQEKVLPLENRQASATWIVTDGVASGDQTNGNQVIVAISDELGRSLFEKNLLIGSQSKFEYTEEWHDNATKVIHELNLGSTTGVALQTTEVESTYVRDKVGDLRRSKTADAPADVFKYDDLGYLVLYKVDAALGLQEEYKTDVNGNITKLTQTIKSPKDFDGSKRVTESSYDESGILREVKDAENQLTSISVGAVTVSIDPDGNGPAGSQQRNLSQTVVNAADGAETTEQSDAAGRPVRIVGVYGGEDLFKYNAAGDLLESFYHSPSATTTVGLPGITTVNTTPDRRTVNVYDDLGRLRKSTQDINPATAALESGSVTTAVDHFLPGVDGTPASGPDVVEVNQYGGKTETTVDNIGQVTKVLGPRLDTSGAVAPSARSVQTYRYDHRPDSHTILVTSTLDAANAGGNPISHDEARSNKQLVSDDGRMLASASKFTATSGTSDINTEDDSHEAASAAYQAVFGAGYVLTSTALYNENLLAKKTQDADGFETTYEYDLGKNRTGTGELTKTKQAKISTPQQYVYNSVGDVIEFRNFQNDGWNREYDKLSRVKVERVGLTVVNSGFNGSKDSREAPLSQLRERTWVYQPSSPNVTYTDGDGRVTTTNIDYANAKRTSQFTDSGSTTASVVQTQFMSPDGFVLVVHANTPGSGFGTGTTSSLSSYDALGRVHQSSTKHALNDLALPNVQETHRYSGADLDKRELAVATGNGAFSKIITHDYDLDALGRAESFTWTYHPQGSGQLDFLGNDARDPWKAEFRYNPDGQLATELRSDWSGTAFAPAINSQRDYRGDGLLQAMLHDTANSSDTPGTGVVGDPSIAEYRLEHTDGGRVNSGFTVVRGLNGSSILAFDKGNYNYDQFGNATTVSPVPAGLGSATREDDLIPGFQRLSKTEHAESVHVISGELNHIIADSEFIYWYDKEGRLTERKSRTYATDGSTLVDDDDPNIRETYNFDAAGRLRSIERVEFKDAFLPGTGNADYHTYVTSYAYDAGGRLVGVKHKHTDHSSDATTTDRVGYYGGLAPELVFNLNGSDHSITSATTFSPADGSPLAVSRVRKEPIWTLGDTGGSARTYVLYEANGGIDAIAHVTFDGHGKLGKRIVADPNGRLGDGGTSFSDDLPIIFAGRGLAGPVIDTGFGVVYYYRSIGGGLYNPLNGRTLAALVNGGVDSFQVASPYPNARITGPLDNIGQYEGWNPFARAAFNDVANGGSIFGAVVRSTGHTALDIIGLIPLVGNIADLANAAWYAAEGNHEMAALSGAAALPLVGYAAGAAKVYKVAAKSTKAGSAAMRTAKFVVKSRRIANVVKNIEAGVGIATGAYGMYQAYKQDSWLMGGLSAIGFGAGAVRAGRGLHTTMTHGMADLSGFGAKAKKALQNASRQLGGRKALCFVAGTPVLVPIQTNQGVLLAEALPPYGERNWRQGLAAVAVSTGVAAFAMGEVTAAKKKDEERRKRVAGQLVSDEAFNENDAWLDDAQVLWDEPHVVASFIDAAQQQLNLVVDSVAKELDEFWLIGRETLQ